jgi:hypothetical protein
LNRKLPPDAFSFYFSLGPGRSYQEVAKKFEVSKRAVSNLAERENWQARLADLDRKARDKADEKALETLDEMNERHLKVLRFIQGRAIDTLKSMSLDSAMDAIRAYAMSLDKERMIRGEPTDRNVLTVEEICRDEYARWLKPIQEAKVGEDPAA